MVMRVAVIVPMMKAVVFPAGSVALSENVPLKEFPSRSEEHTSALLAPPNHRKNFPTMLPRPTNHPDERMVFAEAKTI